MTELAAGHAGHDGHVGGRTRTPRSPLSGAGPLAAVQRAIGELVAGRAVIVVGDDGAARWALPVEALGPGVLAGLAALAAGPLELVVSATRAAALGRAAAGPVALALPPGTTEARVLDWACGAEPAAPPAERPAASADVAAVELAKLAQVLPALLAAPVDPAALHGGVLRVAAADVAAGREAIAGTLRRVAAAPVPLRAASNVEWIVFRDALGQSWSMVRVGRPDPDAPVPLRLHSACLTGDAFSSLRCDCGDQLRMALAKIESLGGGVLLYLAQEGCGLGLANKMRAYRLQEAGLDTVDANTALGFDADERRYDAAAAMLRAEGIGRVALLTNNPAKVDALRAAGIDVAERIPLLAPVQTGNRRYLEAKRRRAGHLIGDASGTAGS